MLGTGYGSSTKKYLLRDSRYPTPVLACRFPRFSPRRLAYPPVFSPVHLHLSITDRQGRFVNINRDLRSNKNAQERVRRPLRHAGVTIPRRLSLIAGEIYVNSKINARASKAR